MPTIEDLTRMITHDVGEALTKRYGDFRAFEPQAVAEYYHLIRTKVEQVYKLTCPQARPFTESDWEGLAGAEAWPINGPLSHCANKLDEQVANTLPVIREFALFVVVCDKSGVQLILADAEGWFSLPEVKFPCQACALAFLNGLPTDFKPEDLGFTESP